MNKLTDSEIVKALECCIKNECEKCNVYDETYGEVIDCLHAICENALDLINRQKAEIERLQGKLNSQKAINTNLGISYTQARTEAIKEFIEWLQANGYINFSTKRRLELVKGMVGNTFTKVEHNSLCETETYKSR